jgi:hypothetical protein
MKLETDSLALGFDRVTAEQLREAFKDNARRGERIILSQQLQVYMQAAGEAEGPYTLEYRDGDDQHHLQAGKDFRKEDVLRAFLWYLAGDPRWRTDFHWRRREPWWRLVSASPTKPFKRLWLIATFGYMVVLIALYVYAGSDWGWHMQLPLPSPMAALAPVFVSFGLLAIYMGEAWVKGGPFYRSKDPIKYWAYVAMMLSLGIFMFLGSIGLFAQ